MEKNRNIAKILIIICVFFLGMYLNTVLIQFFPSENNKESLKVEKDVTITETGIAEAVEKVYDSVVIVSSVKDNIVISSGTGFVFKTDDKKAYILTNSHVVNNEGEVNVTFTNQNTHKATLEGLIEFEDIAVLSLDKKHIIKVATLYDGDNLRVGDTTFAIGGPLDPVYSWTVTRGIVSGLNRKVEVSLTGSNVNDFVMEVIQTDTAINKGNSGGPLSNSNGEVIGVTSMKLVSSGVEGMGFAIPIDVALISANKILNGTHKEQPYLGIGMLNLTEAARNANYNQVVNSSNQKEGVFITEVEPGSAADKAGIKEKDIIIKLENYNISSIAYLRYTLFKQKIGAKIKITYIREGKPETTNLIIGSRN